MAFSFKSFVAEQFKSTRKELKEQKNLLISITQKLEQMSKKDDQILAIVKELDEATNEIAADLNKAIEDVKSNGVSDASIASLQAAADKVKALGADPVNPIPAPPAEPGAPA